MMEDTFFTPALNSSLRRFFGEFIRKSLTSPGYALFFCKTFFRQTKAARKRKQNSRMGLQVPPMMFISVTNSCNLNCRGCYSHALRKTAGEEMDSNQIRRIIGEGADLGVSIVVLAGGEPLLKEELLSITAEFPQIIFFLFTNGLLISEYHRQSFKKQKNLIPIISLEGYRDETDGRRGSGVFRRLQSIICSLGNTWYGVSLTVTRSNFHQITDDDFARGLMSRGCRIVFFVEYSAVEKETDHLVLTDVQRNSLCETAHSFRNRYPGLFVVVPGDEEQYGGCLSAGRGFFHVSADGSMEPCPFARVSDMNLKTTPLKEALKSRLFSEIRKTPELLVESGSGCALLHNADYLEKLAKAAPVEV